MADDAAVQLPLPPATAAPDSDNPPISPELELNSAGRVLLRAFSTLVAALPALLLAALLLLLFRSALVAGTARLASAADRDPTIRSLLSRLSSSTPAPPSPSARRRGGPFLLSRAGDADAEFALSASTLAHSASSSPSPHLRRNSSSFIFLASGEAALNLITSPKPYKVRIPASLSSQFFFAIPAPSPSADRTDAAGNAKLFAGLDFDGHDATAILYLLTLLSSAHALAIFGFVAAYSATLGVVFYAVASTYLHRQALTPGAFLSGTVLGVRRLTGFAFLRWAARDALVQFLCLWFFADVRDQSQLFKLFVAAKMMPFSLSSASPWPALAGAGEVTALSGFFFTWALLDAVVSVLFTVVPWVIIMDHDPRRPGRDAVKEGCYLVFLMPTDTVMIKWWETVVCGSFGRAAMVAIGGKFLGGLIFSLAEVYFMVVWLIFYLAARCKKARLEGRQFGMDDLADAIGMAR